jgi:hypothetical protein
MSWIALILAAVCISILGAGCNSGDPAALLSPARCRCRMADNDVRAQVPRFNLLTAPRCSRVWETVLGRPTMRHACPMPAKLVTRRVRQTQTDPLPGTERLEGGHRAAALDVELALPFDACRQRPPPFPSGPGPGLPRRALSPLGRVPAAQVVLHSSEHHLEHHLSVTAGPPESRPWSQSSIFFTSRHGQSRPIGA